MVVYKKFEIFNKAWVVKQTSDRIHRCCLNNVQKWWMGDTLDLHYTDPCFDWLWVKNQKNDSLELAHNFRYQQNLYRIAIVNPLQYVQDSCSVKTKKKFPPMCIRAKDHHIYYLYKENRKCIYTPGNSNPNVIHWRVGSKCLLNVYNPRMSAATEIMQIIPAGIILPDRDQRAFSEKIACTQWKWVSLEKFIV